MNIKFNILYADDDGDDVLLMSEVFEKYRDSIELITFSNGLEILAYLNSLPANQPDPCLIIIDINMPLLNGKETLVRIRNNPRYQEVPVIIFTTSSAERDKEFAFNYNAGFFTKPINTAQLENVATIFIEQCSHDIQEEIKKQAH